MSYYGLYIPVVKGGVPILTSGTNIYNGGGGDSKENESAESPFVFRTKSEALKVLKMHKDARLKEFFNEDDAIKYAQTGFEIVQNKYNDTKTSTAALEKAAFRAPTKQELIEFRKMIENGDYERVKKVIWDNPRYLISSGDTPTTLKEGYRYNAMHVCAISRRPRIAELILETVSDPKFVDLLTGKKNDQKMCQELCRNLLDYYLNIPEKGRNETPLHFASKMGCPEMVEVLISYPECRITPNYEGLLPQQIICSRISIPHQDVTMKIQKLFDARYYVPVLRCNDNAIPAQIGQPFSANNPPNLNCDPLTPEVEIKALAGPMTKDQANKFFRRWKTPPRLGSNVSSPIANNLFISPIKSRKSLPSTPRSAGGVGSASVANSSLNSPTVMLQRRSLFNSTPQRKDHLNGTNDSNGFVDQSLLLDDSIDDHENGNNHDKENQHETYSKAENNNNNHGLENKFKPSMCPGTPLFKIKKDAFFTYREQMLASPMPGGMEVNNQSDFLNCSDIYDSPGYMERHVKNTDTEKGIECIGRNLAKEQRVEWREYWDFLEEFIDISSTRGMQRLENYLAQKQRKQESLQNKKTRHNSEMMEEVCSALEKFGFGATASSDSANNQWRNGVNQRFENGFRSTSASVTTNMNASTAHQSSTPYTYVEKSLQVHARRMTKTIVHNIDNVVSINDALLLELRRVKSLIYSFKEDVSFLNVNFEKVHSRIGNLVSTFLENSQEITIEMKAKILKILQNLLLTPGERREHIECVCSRILYKLEHPAEQILPENLKTEETCTKVWSQEHNCDCQWESNLSRKTSRRNRMEARYKNHQRMKQQEKALKQQEIDKCSSNMQDFRNPSVGNDSSSDDTEEDVFWSDFDGSDSEDDSVFVTPPESPSLMVFDHSSFAEDAEDDGYKIFIYGNEPTKRDLDVLNAIFHIDIDKTKHPSVHSWKEALLRYTTDEMDFFPSPRVVNKSHTFSSNANNTYNNMPPPPQTPPSQHKTQGFLRSNTTVSPRQQQPPSLTSSSSALAIIREPILQLPTVKRLFMSPGRPKPKTANMTLSVNNTTTTTTTTSPTLSSSKTNEEGSKPAETITSSPIAIPGNSNVANLRTTNQRPLTPLNKLQGLFSAYRERLDNSPLPSPMNDYDKWFQ